MSAAALALLRRILGGDLAAVLAGSPPEGADEVAELATRSDGGASRPPHPLGALRRRALTSRRRWTMQVLTTAHP